MLANPEPDRPHRFAAPASIDDFLLFRMSKVVALGGSVVTRICEGRFGITRREWTVLATIAPHGELPWAEAARRCEIDGARLSRAVNGLVARKLLRREKAPSRLVHLRVTTEGAALYEEIFPLAREVNAAIARALDAEALGQLEGALARLHERGEEVVRDTPAPKAERLRGGTQRRLSAVLPAAGPARLR